MTDTIALEDPLPRELSPGLFWLGGCAVLPPVDDLGALHGYASLYLVAGTERSIVVEGGTPDQLDIISSQFDVIFEQHDIPPVEYVFATHGEPPHSSGIGRWLERFPDAVLVGDTRDFHLYFDGLEKRRLPCTSGDRLDLGGTEFVFVPAVIKDLPATLWGFETSRRALFTGDGFAYSHIHAAGQCGRVAEEVEENLEITQMTATFAERALTWMTYCDMEPYIAESKHLILDELKAEIILPTHGLPITDPELIAPRVFDGFRAGSRVSVAR